MGYKMLLSSINYIFSMATVMHMMENHYLIINLNNAMNILIFILLKLFHMIK